MSDYLWDKKGEPDAEVARLETMLGAFKHEPRPLVLPAEALTPEPRPSGLLPFVSRLRASRLFAPVALAAAALLVASILVASVFLRTRVANEERRAVAQEPAPPPPDARKDERAVSPETGRMLEPPPPVGGVKDGSKVESAAAGKLPNGLRQKNVARLAAAPVRRQKLTPIEEAGTGGGLTLETMSTRQGASALVENTRLLTKEQLVYALRLTGAKLKDVRERAQGLDESKSRPR